MRHSLHRLMGARPENRIDSEGRDILPVVKLAVFETRGRGRLRRNLGYDIAIRLASEGIRVGVFGPTALRLIIHLDLDPGAVEEALAAFGRVAAA